MLTVLAVLAAMAGGCSTRTAFERSTFAPASSTVVVFIHGFTSDNSIWPQDAIAAMAGGLNGDSYLFSYGTWLFDTGQTSQTTDDAAAMLAQELSRPEFAGREINLIGHSQGGIVALRTLLKLPKGSVRRIIMLGTPLFGSKSVPPDWLLPAQSGQLRELNEYSRSLLELNIELQKHLADGKIPAILSVLSSADEYVYPHSAFVNLRGSRNTVVDISHNDLPLLLTGGIVDLRARWNAASPPPDGMENTLLIKAPDLRELHYFLRKTVDYDPPEADLRVDGYSLHFTVGRDMAAEHKYSRPPILESLKRHMSEDRLYLANIMSHMMVVETHGSDGSITRSRLPETRYAGIGSLPSSCAGRGRTLTRIWVKRRDTLARTGAAVDSEMLECLSDADITYHLYALGYDVLLQRQILRRTPDGDIIVREQMPMGRMIARHFLANSSDRKICTPLAKRLDYDFVDGRFRLAPGTLSDDERTQMETLLSREGAPPPPELFSRCKPDERIALSGYWVGDYLVIHNLKPGTYRFSPVEIMAPFNDGDLGDGLEIDAEAVFKRYGKRAYDIMVTPGTTVWQLPDNR